MTAVEDKTRAAMDAITGLVERVPPLTLPPPAAARAGRQWGRLPSPWRRWGSWLAPVTAAVAVLAIALTLVAVRDLPDNAAAPKPTSTSLGTPVVPATGIPEYNLSFSQPVQDTTVPNALVLRSTLTGKKLFTLQPPAGLSFSGVTGAADDRTFVADAHRDPYGVWNSDGRSRTWYLVRIVGTGSRASLTMRKLPIPATPVGTDVDAIALSPDATMLAVVSASGSIGSDVEQALRVYSVATGAVLHTWSSTASRDVPIEAGGEIDSNTAVSWVGERALAYETGTLLKPRTVGLAVKVVALSRPDGATLGTDPTAATPLIADRDGDQAPFGCEWASAFTDVLITGNGSTYVCGGSGTTSAKLPALYCLDHPTWNTLGFAGYSMTTGKPTGILSGYRTGCAAFDVLDYPVWVNSTGSLVIGYMMFGDRTSERFGVFSHGTFRPLPYPIPGNSYQYSNGSLLDVIAW